MPNIFDLFKQIETRPQAATGPITHLIVGLGNPGSEYENTRHNAGFLAIDALASHVHASIRTAKFQALIGDAVIAGHHVLLMKPQTFMNASGDAVQPAAAFYKIKPESILVLSDDINLDIGRTRLRASGSDGGQKGLRSIIARLGTDAFPRFRLGVGAKPESWDMVNWVLSRFTDEERKGILSGADKLIQALPFLLDGDLQKAMGICNGK